MARLIALIKERQERYEEAIAAAGLFILAVTLLTGCASTFEPPQPPTEVPVAVSCVDERPERPQLRSEAEILAMDDYRAVLALRAERLKAELYIGKLEDVVTACQEAPRLITAPNGADKKRGAP